MNRNIYDTDCVTWSPQGRIFQIEYANEATKQGTCCVAIKSNSHAVLVALRRSISKLASHNSKIFKVDDHVGATFSGITADANLIVDQMRLDCMNHKYVYESNAPVGRLLEKIGTTSQKNTMSYGKRPYGVSLLIAGVDKKGVHVFETHPTGDYDEYVAHAFGARCQSARTYLEQHASEFPEAAETELVAHALRALASTVTSDTGDLTKDSVHVALVGLDKEFESNNNTPRPPLTPPLRGH
ncbi:proteasome subunit alpha type [Gregarina niphandrodes]|uniref:Proteasome subunit alpha type n=1 Tax=Gregarina niphandrodes TaxID=110365 RepID=A0A023B2R6_GRENI|nr:proteasome subunit alpha type [Gregarina niphandrodes]EZG55186.1 proteasome subunit alpha type [Gregarina niphandrodes]|eukprot:XP_011131713.1 proteasome subunit alpha type [Gregarina niphandrodes]